MQRKYGVHVQWSDEDEAFVATSAEFLGLTGVDPDQDAAIAELREAIDMALEVMAESGTEAPTVMARSESSGQFRLRVRRSTHAQLSRLAAQEGVSLNALVSAYVEAGLGGTVAITRAARELMSAIALAATVSRAAAEHARSGSTTSLDISGLAGTPLPMLSSAPGANTMVC